MPLLASVASWRRPTWRGRRPRREEGRAIEQIKKFEIKKFLVEPGGGELQKYQFMFSSPGKELQFELGFVPNYHRDNGLVV